MRPNVASTIALVLMMAAIGTSDAAPFTWTSTGTAPLTDGGGNWNGTGGTNWFTGTSYGAWGNTNADTATFGVGSGAAGTITVGSVTANGITFNTAGSGNYTLSSGTITMAGTTPTIAVNASGTTTLTSVLAGSAGLRKTGAGTLLLGTGNTYTGTTTITEGIVQVTSINNTLGNGNGGAVVLNGGAIQMTSATAAFNPLWVITVGAGGGTLLNTSGQSWGLRNNLGGSGTVALRGSFSMASSQNFFSGKWVIDGAFIDQAQNPWGSATGDDVITLVNNGQLFSRGGTLASATQGITISSGTGVFNNAQFAAAATTIPAKLSGVGAARFIPTNGAIITLTNTGNSYAGDTLVSGTTTNRGFLRIGASEVVPDGPGKGNVFIFNNGAAASLNLNGFNETINGLSSLSPLTSTHSTDSQVDNTLVSSTSTLTLGGNDASQTFAGVIQNSLSGSGAIVALTKIGSGTQTLSGANTYWGPTNINAGTLRIGAGSTTGALSGSSAISGSVGATLAFERSNTVTQGTNFASVIGGAINLSQLGSGTLVLNGANTFTGTTRVFAGTLSLAGANALQNSTLDLNSDDAGSVLFGITGTNTYNIGGLIGSRNLATSGSVVLSVGGNGASGAYSGVISGGGAFTKVGTGLLTLSGSSTFSGPFTIGNGMVAVAAIGDSGVANPLGTNATIGLGASTTTGTLRYTGSGETSNRGFSLSGTAGSGGVIEANGAGPLVFTGAVTAAAGNKTLTLAGSNAGSNSIGAIGNPSSSGSTSLLKQGAGRWVLSGSGNYTGSTTIEQGELLLAANASGAGEGALGANTGATITIGSATGSGTAALLLNAGVMVDSRGFTIPGGTQATVIGALGSGTFGSTGSALITFGRDFTLRAATGATLVMNNPWTQSSGTSVNVTVGGIGNEGTVVLGRSLGATGTVRIERGTLSLATSGAVAGSLADAAAVVVGPAGSSGAILDVRDRNAAYSFGAGQTLSGIGTLQLDADSPVSIAGLFSPGNSPGLFTFDGSGTTTLAGTTLMEIEGTSRGVTGGYDAVNLANGASLVLGGALQLWFGSTFPEDTKFNLFTLTGTGLSGNFTTVSVSGSSAAYTGLTWSQNGSVWNSSSTVGGQSLRFNSADGTLVVVPEPATLALAAVGIGLGGWAALRRRK